MLSVFLALSFLFSCSLRGDEATSNPVRLSREIRRGFNAALFATRDNNHLEEWQNNFDSTLRVGAKLGTNSKGFVIGAKFGFSFQISRLDNSNVNASSETLHQLAIAGTLARVSFEEGKRVVGMNDSELLRIVPVRRAAFIAWKNSSITSDNDKSVLSEERWLYL
jgi:hypothetical protein